jgi:hypothetical protein
MVCNHTLVELGSHTLKFLRHASQPSQLQGVTLM